ncbi:TetR family transcriptional regulator [Mycobacteroides abscessus subsp. abscessus]|nr:TetR family transcriptional regulator [Mycobacteroides abscessus subsp. abscessus]
MRGIAREMGMAPAALFRYFETQAALITALCVDANGALAQAMSDGQKAAPESDSAARLRAGDYWHRDLRLGLDHRIPRR